MAESEMRVATAQLRAVADLAGLTLSDDRLTLLVPQVQRLLASFSAVDELDLSEVEPEIVFRARWEESNGH